MKVRKHAHTPARLSGEIQLARIRLTKAESQLKFAKEEARLAKRRRKEAKRAARRAKKQARLAKREVAEARQLLADAEVKLARAGQMAAKARARKKAVGKVAPGPRKNQPARATAAAAPRAVKPKRSAAKPRKPVSGMARMAGGAKPGIVVPRNSETPGVAVSVPGSRATAPAGRADEKTHGGAVELEKPVEPLALARHAKSPDQPPTHQKPNASTEPGE